MYPKSSEAIEMSKQWLSNPSEQFNYVRELDTNKDCNDCLLRIIPLALWGSKLTSDDDLFEAVRLYCAFTNGHNTVVEACYLYCYACKLLLLEECSSCEAYEKTRKESERRAMISGFSTIKYWMENDIEQDNLIKPHDSSAS